MPDADLPPWLDKVEVNTVVVLTLDGGECMTAEILEFNDNSSELIVDVVSSDHPYPNSAQRRHAIPANRVVSVEPLPCAEQPWQYSDPCRRAFFSLPRFLLLTTLFLCLVLGGLPLFFLLMKRPYGLQEASAVAYTLFAGFFTFSATKGFRPYMFTCPAVRNHVPHLLRRHLGFLVALFALQTAAVAARPNLSAWWNTENGRSGETPFDLVLLLLCLGLGYAQVFTNRSLLDRAHVGITRVFQE